MKRGMHCTVLYCTILYCTVQYCTVLYNTVLYCTSLYCTVLRYSTKICSLNLHDKAGRCSIVVKDFFVLIFPSHLKSFITFKKSSRKEKLNASNGSTAFSRT